MNRDSIREVLQKFGWDLDDDDLFHRYMTDAWTYNLVNALATLHEDHKNLVAKYNTITRPPGWEGTP